MKVTMIETTTNKNGVVVKKENLKADDLWLDLLKTRNATNAWGILGYRYFDKCSQTKYGYRVTEFTLINGDNTEVIHREFIFK